MVITHQKLADGQAITKEFRHPAEHGQLSVEERNAEVCSRHSSMQWLKCTDKVGATITDVSSLVYHGALIDGERY